MKKHTHDEKFSSGALDASFVDSTTNVFIGIFSVDIRNSKIMNIPITPDAIS